MEICCVAMFGAIPSFLFAGWELGVAVYLFFNDAAGSGVYTLALHGARAVASWSMYVAEWGLHGVCTWLSGGLMGYVRGCVGASWGMSIVEWGRHG